MYLGQVRLRRDSGEVMMEVSSNCGRAEGVEAIGYMVLVCLNLPFLYVLVLCLASVVCLPSLVRYGAAAVS